MVGKKTGQGNEKKKKSGPKKRNERRAKLRLSAVVKLEARVRQLDRAGLKPLLLPGPRPAPALGEFPAPKVHLTETKAAGTEKQHSLLELRGC